MLRALAVSLALVSANVAADWATELELGAVLTSGNTEEENLKFRIDAVRDGERFKHGLHADTLRNSREGDLTAQRLYSFYKADYKLSGDGSLFGRVSYEDDRFNGFDYQADLTGGYTRTLSQTDTTRFEVDLGAGVRHSVPEVGDTETEAVVRLAGAYTWQVSESAQFRQLLSSQIGEESTISRSETSLQTTVVGSLAMKLTLTIKNNSEVPPGREKTDTETSVTLVYKF